MSFYHSWKPYVPVAKRREQAARKLAKLQKKGATTASPVVIEGLTIASSFWGKAWCGNLERYSDYASRLPRGRSYVRNGSVLDLQIAEGEITARVSGSDLYSIRIAIAPVPAERWTSLAEDCAGTIDSVVELMQGRIDKGVMDRVCRQGDGLFPSPKEIKLSCSCPDWADMCKHVAAALYGVGARLDRQPELLFKLRGVDAQDMIAKAGAHLATQAPAAASGKVLAGEDMAALFGLDMAEEDVPAPAPAALPTRSQSERSTKRMPGKAVASKLDEAGRGSADIISHASSEKGKTSARPEAIGMRASATPSSQNLPLIAEKRRRTAIRTPAKQTSDKVTHQARSATTKSAARLEARIEEVTVDARTEHEQAVGFYTVISERLALPFKTKIRGRDVDVVEIALSDENRLLAVCKTGRKRQHISLADMALPSKRPAGAEWIVAYRRWCSRNGSG